MAIVAVTVLAFLSIFSATSIAGQPTCQLALSDARSNSWSDVGIGSRFQIQTPGTKRLNVRLVGRQGERIYLVEEKSRRVLVVRSDSPFISWSKNGAGMDILSLQAIPTIEEQTGKTCMAEATATCLELLNELGGIQNPGSQVLVKSRPVLIQFLNQFLSIESYRERRASAPNRFIRTMTSNQHEFRARVLREMGIKIRDDASARRLRRHLSAGKPALIDLKVRWQAHDRVDLLNSISMVEDGLGPAPGRSKDSDGHTVAAVGIIEFGWFRDPLVLVLDSNFGNFELWPLSEIKKADPHFTLVGG